MSQRECVGFNWPPLSIAAEEPVSISPLAVSRAGPLCVGQPAADAIPGRRSMPCDGPPFGPSCWHGVGQPANLAASDGFSPGFMPRLIFASGSSPAPLFVELGVGQPAILPICVRLTPVIPSVIPDPLRSPSEAAGVGQPVIAATFGSCFCLPSFRSVEAIQ